MCHYYMIFTDVDYAGYKGEDTLGPWTEIYYVSSDVAIFPVWEAMND